MGPALSPNSPVLSRVGEIMQDITDFLAFEVKKEMADRYFGFRKQIEDDTAAYKHRIALSFLDLETNIGSHLLRLYILLHDEQQIASFISLVGLPEDFFFDSYILESPSIKKRVFAGATTRGFTRKRRFINLFFDTYKSLAVNIDAYIKTLDELTEEQETIREEINLFYRKNDIDTIISFLRRLDSPSSGFSSIMQTGRTDGAKGSLSDQLRLHPPLSASEMLPSIPSIPELKKIKPQLLQLATHAYSKSSNLDVKQLCSATEQ